jgi:hypothetical protein
MAQLSTLRYPSDLAEQSGDWVMFQFFEYSTAFANSDAPPQLNAEADVYLKDYNVGTQGKLARGNYKVNDKQVDYPTIGLYMPEDVGAHYNAKWGGRDFSPLGAALLGSAGAMTSGIRSGQNGLEDSVNRSIKNVDSLKGGLMPWFVAKGIQEAMNGIPGFGGGVGINDVLASTQGTILNPNTEVLYSGPDLRTFGLTFKMTARNENESNDIRAICNTFKKVMLPKLSKEAQVFVKVPTIVEITFKNKTENNKWVTQYKRCAIGSVDINYTADGAWSTFQSGAPTAVILTLQFIELKLIFSEEVNDSTNY